MDNRLIAIPLILAGAYFVWKIQRPAERRYFDRIETVTPNPQELEFRLGPRALKDRDFTVSSGASLRDFFWGLFTLLLGLLILGLHHRYHMIQGSPAPVLIGLWGYTLYRWLRGFLIRKDRVRIRGGMIHYYRFGRLRWKLQLKQVARVDVYFDAIFEVKTTNKNAFQRHLELHTNIGETFRIVDYERFEDAELLRLLLSSGNAV